MKKLSAFVSRHARARLARVSLSLAFVTLLASPALAQTVLPTVVVSATRFEEPADTLPAGLSVITADQIRASGATSVSEAIMRLLGVPGRLDLTGANGYGLDLRGFGATADNNQVVIVDGLRLNEGDSAQVDLSGIAIDQVERIEVLRGNAAVLYGEGATGGAIVITTKAGRGVERKNSARLYAGAGSRGLRVTRAGATLAAGGFSLDVDSRDRRADGHRDNFASGSHGLDATVQWSNDWLRLGARAGRDALHSGLPGSLTAAQYAADPTRTFTPADHGAVQRHHGGLFVDAHLGDWRILLDANRRGKRSESFLFGGLSVFEVEAENTGLRARHEGRFAGLGNIFVVGVDQSDWKRNTILGFGNASRSESRAVYLKDELTLPGSGTHLSAGWRTERLRKSAGPLVATTEDRLHAWDLGLSQPLAADWSVYARVGESYRLANLDELGFTLSGVKLRPQTSRDLEAGLRWKAGGHRAELRVYRHELRDEIGFNNLLFVNLNYDDTRRQGVELETQHALSKDVDLNLNLAWRQARFTAGANAGNDVTLVPRRTLALRAEWRPVPGHRINAGVSWVSSQHSDFANRCRMPSYSLLDVRYAYQWKNAEFAVGIDNLSDRGYYTQAFGCNVAGAFAGQPTAIYPEAGRTVTASVRVAF